MAVLKGAGLEPFRLLRAGDRLKEEPMETLNSTAAAEHRRDLMRRARASARAAEQPRTQVRRWVQLKHLYGNREERWARPVREGSSADPACATC
jgi:hypothetical protein